LPQRLKPVLELRAASPSYAQKIPVGLPSVPPDSACLCLLCRHNKTPKTLQ
jgi:hypothetical protein